MIAAVASSFHNSPIDSDILFLGEVGLTGEVRSVSRVEDRLREAAAMGFRRCFLPERNAAQMKDKVKGIELIPVRKVGDLTERLFK
jgi:DNA repair protein RadA/Sms